ncbi:uncharacterized protein LOC143030617 [Oratosquilla oratoria]|uniref:uncharacterized protein LOC143030617 n=1 Tax=Oratosquilla oratoria TaxID=337810 RepID=UPI003F758534
MSQVMRKFVKNTECSRKKQANRMFMPRAGDVDTVPRELVGTSGMSDQNFLMSGQQHPSTMHGVAEGTRFVLGALRRPEFDIILRNALNADKDDQQATDDDGAREPNVESEESEVHLIPRPFWRNKNTPSSFMKLSSVKRST